MTRITKPPGERKRDIIETAKKLFAEQGYENPNVYTNCLLIKNGLLLRAEKNKNGLSSFFVSTLQ